MWTSIFTRSTSFLYSQFILMIFPAGSRNAAPCIDTVPTSAFLPSPSGRGAGVRAGFGLFTHFVAAPLTRPSATLSRRARVCKRHSGQGCRSLHKCRASSVSAVRCRGRVWGVIMTKKGAPFRAPLSTNDLLVIKPVTSSAASRWRRSPPPPCRRPLPAQRRRLRSWRREAPGRAFRPSRSP